MFYIVRVCPIVMKLLLTLLESVPINPSIVGEQYVFLLVANYSSTT